MPKALSSPEWQFIDPVSIDLMVEVEIGNRPARLRIPGVDDLAIQSAPLRDPLGIGHDVDGFREGVVEIKLQAVRKSLVKARLQSVVIGVAFRSPRVERFELFIEECVRTGYRRVVVERFAVRIRRRSG